MSIASERQQAAAREREDEEQDLVQHERPVIVVHEIPEKDRCASGRYGTHWDVKTFTTPQGQRIYRCVYCLRYTARSLERLKAEGLTPR